MKKFKINNKIKDFLTLTLFIYFIVFMCDAILINNIKTHQSIGLGINITTVLLELFLTTFITFLIYTFKRKRLVFSIFSAILIVLSFSQNLHFTYINKPYSIQDIFLLREAGGYFFQFFLIFKTWYLIYAFLIFFTFFILTYINENKDKYVIKNKKEYIYIISSIVILRILAIVSIQQTTVKGDYFNNYENKKIIYEEFEDRNRALTLTGLVEYTLRDIYIFIFENKTKVNVEEIEKLDKYFSDKILDVNEENEYTGMFKDKNLLVIMLESIDSFLINETDMPNIYKLSKEGMNFVNRYAPAYNGGMTINSEYSVLSGYFMPEITNPYLVIKNKYNYSLPNLFRNSGYTVNSVHANNGFYYNRINLHPSLGFENHFPAADIVENYEIFDDRNLVKNDEIVNKIFPNKDKNFFTFITTISGHDIHNLAHLDASVMEKTKINAGYTDKLVGMLIEEMKKRDILDDTAILIYTDHYMKLYEPFSEIVEIKGEEDTNLLQKQPCIIWSNDIQNKEIDILCDTVDIMPTLLNLYGIDYNPSIYLGQDIFSKNHEEVVYFKNAWLDKKGNYSLRYNDDQKYLKKMNQKKK